MVKVALLVRLEVKPGHEQTVADFLAGAAGAEQLLIVYDAVVDGARELAASGRAQQALELRAIGAELVVEAQWRAEAAC